MKERVSDCYIYIACGEVFNTTGSWRSLLERTINYSLKTPAVTANLFLLFFFPSVAFCLLCKQAVNIARQMRKPSILSCQVVPLFQIIIDYFEFYLQPISLTGTFRHFSLFFLNP